MHIEISRAHLEPYFEAKSTQNLKRDMPSIAFQVTNQHAHAKCNLSHGQVKPSASIQQKGNAMTQSGTQIQTVYLHAYSCQMQIGYLHANISWH